MGWMSGFPENRELLCAHAFEVSQTCTMSKVLPFMSETFQLKS